MLDHVNSYILQPLSEQLVEWTNFPSVFPSISANHISYLGVVAALIASRLIFMDMRRTAVFMFIIRQFLDDLDGLVARFHLGIDTKKQVWHPLTLFVLTVSIPCIGVIAQFQWLHRRWHLRWLWVVGVLVFSIPLQLHNQVERIAI